MIDYGKDILCILCEAGGEGLSVQKLSLHIHNANNSLFNPLSYEDVHRDVRSWLMRNSRQSKDHTPLVCRGKRRGYYKLNDRSQEVCHLLLEFKEDESTDVPSDKKGDKPSTQLDLFE